MTGEKRALNEFEQAAELLPGRGDMEVDNRATRYLFFAGDEPGMMTPGGMSVNTPCIPKKMVFRAQVTPCVSTPVWTRKEEIPEGQMLAGSEAQAQQNKQGPGKAAYLLYAGPEAKNLLNQYGHESDPSLQWGLVELKELRGLPLEQVQLLKVTSRFFPKYPKLPDTNMELADHIRAVRADIEAGNDQHKNILLACADNMLTACEHAQEHQSRLASESNMRVTLNPMDPGYKLAFDERDKVYAKRSGVPLATNAMRGNQSDAIQQIARSISIQPQAATVDPQMIAAIVAATVQAMNGGVGGGATVPTVQPEAVEEKKAPTKRAA